MSVAPIQAIDLLGIQAPARTAAAAATPPLSFSDLLTQGVDAANSKIAKADTLVARAVVDDTIPLHQVTYALEEARIALELMVQVRNRLIDASQQLLNMQV
ncbi:MAG: flagellar hook-basal body complex protein FliE [Novosphingobium sp.]